MRTGIHRDPVGALGKHGNAVHLEIETDPVFVGMAYGFQVAQTDFLFHRAGIGRDGQFIQRLFTVSGRIPQPGIFHFEHGIDLIDPPMEFRGDRLHGFIENKYDLLDTFKIGIDLGRDFQRACAAPVGLAGIDMLDPDPVGALQGDLAVNAADGNAGSPVPTALTLDLTHEIQIRHPAETDPVSDFQRIFFRFGFGIFFHGEDDCFDGIFTGMQKIFHLGPDPAEHVPAGNDSPAVDPDLADRIKRIHIEPDPFLVQESGIELKIPAPGPVILAHPLQVLFLQPDIRIGNQPRVDQCGTVFSRDLSWNCPKIRLIAR